MSVITANIFNIQRFSIEDGPGIRTTVFFKGCPLSCVWCHNPESVCPSPELMYSEQKCISCNSCQTACKNSVFSVKDGKIIIDRSRCKACNACASFCPTRALEIAGREETVENILKEALSDKDFYKNSGGGLTLSGGEPLFQPKAAISLCRGAKEAGLHVVVETSGFANEKVIKEISPFVDLFLFDYKAPKELHKELTGVPQEPILNSLQILSTLNKEVILRCPVVPNCNYTDEFFNNIVALALKYDNIKEVNLLPYHPLGSSKLKQLGREAKYKNESFLPPEELTERALEMQLLAKKTVRVV